MRAQKIIIKNIGLIASETIEFNKPLLLFYGDIRQGKSTILNAVKWVLGAEWPKDIIRHGQKEASIEFEFDTGTVTRSWYLNKDGETTVRPLVFIKGGRPVSSPATEIKRFLNPFLLNQNHLANMGETDRKAYFTELFEVDTSKLDKEWTDNDRRASGLRSEVKGYGEIDLTPVERVDASVLKAKLEGIRAQNRKITDDHNSAVQAIRDQHNAEVSKTQTYNIEVQQHNVTRQQHQDQQNELNDEIASLETKLEACKTILKSITEWLLANPVKMPAIIPPLGQLPSQPALIGDGELEQQIQDAGAVNVRAEQYEKNKARAQEKTDKEGAVSAIEERQREIKREKIKLLKGISDKCGIKDLSFDENGTFTYQGTQAGMLSTSQIMTLSSELSALYPEGFGVELLDRGESLGKSIFEFVERAKRDEVTILAAIVGERPATVPTDIGVFVVNDGKITS